MALQGGSIGFTALSVNQGWDYQVHHFFYEHPNYGNLGSSAAAGGALAPILAATGFYSYGLLGNHSEAIVAGHAVTQAVAIAFTYHELLKAVTGRPTPQGVAETEMRSHSETFRFGFMRGGLFWGWPSGHMATNTAAAVALSRFYPAHKGVVAFSYTWIAYMFYGVVAHDGASMHWFSDAVAGTLIGFAIGQTVGNSYLDALHGKSQSTFVSHTQISPTSISGTPGLQIQIML